MKEVNCSCCGMKTMKCIGAINRANKEGRNLYCSRTCSSKGRRKDKPEYQKKLEKRLYDQKYRLKNKELIKIKKQAHCETPSGRAMQKRNRDQQKKQHLEYCRTPEYRKWKKEYDQKHRAKKNYGSFWESFIHLREIEIHIDNREVKQELNLIGKTQIRRRNYERTKRSEFKERPLGDS